MEMEQQFIRCFELLLMNLDLAILGTSVSRHLYLSHPVASYGFLGRDPTKSN
jgi:hypothetical protein